MKEKKPIFVLSFEITFVKAMALLILIAGVWYSMANHDGTVLSLSIITCAGLLGYRKTQETAQKQLDMEREKMYSNPDINAEA